MPYPGHNGGHDTYCWFPKEPCSCGLCPEFLSEQRKKERKERLAQHKKWCDFPKGPCDCGADKHPA